MIDPIASPHHFSLQSNLDTHTPDWPLRAWGLAFLGCVIGLFIHVLTDTDNLLPSSDTITAIRLAFATFLFAASVQFGFVLERTRIRWSASFAILTGGVVGFATYWNGPFSTIGTDDLWQPVCGILCIIIAAPLFQSWRDHRNENGGTTYKIPYGTAFQYAWANLILWCAAWIFVGVACVMIWMLDSLFGLIGIRILQRLLQEEWFMFMLVGTLFGAAVGLLRDREHILKLLQRVVTTVLSVLAPVLAFGLVLFLIAIPFTGLTPLWDATRSTTPILLGCIIGALCLINTVIGEDDTQIPKNPILRLSVPGLAIALSPLALIAAISTGSRIYQYGLTPDRLWAAVFTAIACAFGCAYLYAIIRGKLTPAPYLRSLNLRLAIGVCGLALVLSTPLANFGALSTRDQVARLRNGSTPENRFDWHALRFQFGPSGVKAIRDLSQSGPTPTIRIAAANALKARNAWDGMLPRLQKPEPTFDFKRLTIFPKPVALPPELQAVLLQYNACSTSGPCSVIYKKAGKEAIFIQATQIAVWQQTGATWSNISTEALPHNSNGTTKWEGTIAAENVEIRDVKVRQIFVKGKAIGTPFP